jgi:CubicO group peptidase (beta-lactamase class C family)
MKKVRRRLYGALFALLLASGAAASQNKASQIDDLLQQYHELGQFSGAALVVNSGVIVLREGYGIANQDWQIENSPDTRYLLGSVTKSFTALAVVQLEEQGKLELDATISDYLPSYREDTGSRITLRQLLTHTDGLPGYTSNTYFWQSFENNVPYSTSSFIARYCSGNLEFEPGTQYQYGNSGYSILGAIIEQVTGLNYDNAIARLILDPLKMKNSGQHNANKLINNRASGYDVSIDGYRPATPVYKNLRAAGSMYSTVDDLLLYDRALSAGEIISDDSRSTIFKSREGSFEDTFAYGWNVGELSLDGVAAAKRYMATNGEINGFNAFLLRLPDDDNFIVLLNNTGETDLAGIASNVLRVLYDVPATPPEPQLRDIFYAKLRDGPDKAAFSFYREERKSQPDNYLFFPWPLRILASQFMQDGHYDDAINILRLNLETNPNDSRSFVALAQAQMQSGEPNAAIDSLRKALSLDESNDFATNLLRILQE